MEAAQNTIDADLFSNLSNNSEVQNTAKVTNPRHAYIQKCIHPPSAIPSYEGAPTNDARTQVTPQWVKFTTSRSPAKSVTNVPTPVAGNIVDLTILSTNGAKVNGIVFTRTDAAAGADPFQDVANLQKNDVYDFKNFRNDATLYRPAFKSLTTYLNATMFNNVGTCSTAQFNPNILFAGTILTFAETMSSTFTKFVTSMVNQKVFKMSRETEVEMLYMRFPKHVREELRERLGTNDALSLDPNMLIQVVQFGKSAVPPTSSQIINSSMRSYAGKATEGCFNVHRLNTVSPAWLTAGNTADVGYLPEAAGLYQCYYAREKEDGTFFFGAFVEVRQDNVALTTTLSDTLWSSDMTWCWTRFEGLSPNPNFSGGVSNDNLIFKFYTGYEIQPACTSAWAGLQKLGPKPDLEVMQGLMEAFYELKDGMPAKYNFWGTLASIAGKGLKQFGSGLLKELVSGKSKSMDMSSRDSHKPRKQKNKPKKREQREINDIDRNVQALNKKMNAMSVRQSRERTVKIGPNSRPRQQKRVTLPQQRARSASARPRKRILDE